jgi:hypothetical protein
VCFFVRLEATLNHRGSHSLLARLRFMTGRNDPRAGERRKARIGRRRIYHNAVLFVTMRWRGRRVCEGQRPRRSRAGMVWDVRGSSRLQPGSPSPLEPQPRSSDITNIKPITLPFTLCVSLIVRLYDSRCASTRYPALQSATK